MFSVRLLGVHVPLQNPNQHHVNWRAEIMYLGRTLTVLSYSHIQERDLDLFVWVKLIRILSLLDFLLQIQ